MARMVIEVPDEFKELVAAVAEMVATVVEQGARREGGKAVDYGQQSGLRLK